MEDNFDTSVYWDLKELNPEAEVYTEYQDAFMGFALKGNKYVAVYSAKDIELIIAERLMQDENFLHAAFKEIDGKIEKKNVMEAVSRLARIQAMEESSNLLGDWVEGLNKPIMFFLPKMIENQEDDGDEIFNYGE